MKRIRQTLEYCRPHWPLLALGILAGGAIVIAQMSIPWILHILIDDVLSGHSPDKLQIVVSWLVLAAVATVVGGFVEDYLFVRLSGLIAIDVRNGLAAHLRELPLNYIQNKHSGEIMSLFANDVPVFCQFFQSVIGRSMLDIFRLALTFVVLAVVSHGLTFLALLAIPAYILIPVILSKRVRNAATLVQERQATVSVDLQESISAAKEIRAFNCQEWDRLRLYESFRRLFQTDLRMTILQAGSFATYILYWGVVGIVYIVGGRNVLSGHLSLGSLIASVAYFAFLEEPVRSLVGLNQQFQKALSAGERIFEFLRLPKQSVQRVSTRSLARCFGKVEFDRVCFSYRDGEPVLTDISFTANPGQRIALVGPSGSGKSSIVNLLLRLWEPTKGRILIDGQDITQIEVETLRAMIGVVFQDIFLFAASVHENIRFGNLAAGREALVSAATTAHVDQFIAHFPEGYNTIVGERGTRLSGGQKQRIAIARALVREPKILILDEATSAIDSESERAIHDALQSTTKDRTTFIVAHRLCSVLNADLILVFSSGRIVGSGTHHKLATTCELYRTIHRLQSAEESCLGTPQLAGGTLAEVD